MSLVMISEVEVFHAHKSSRFWLLVKSVVFIVLQPMRQWVAMPISCLKSDDDEDDKYKRRRDRNSSDDRKRDDKRDRNINGDHITEIILQLERAYNKVSLIDKRVRRSFCTKKSQVSG
ncbi:hypothetical protein L2E82_40858 [Cichorium intybus]|uniref:Uncharacterized protein n=1 Tax=Cichorium intybus TaxID=13427 RepID=A0ACB9AMX1_CICIN|nr:hypothetical protein L2E82_40858 [Cichorium intybus]